MSTHGHDIASQAAVTIARHGHHHVKNAALAIPGHDNTQRTHKDLCQKNPVTVEQENSITNFHELSINNTPKIVPLWSTPTLINDDITNLTNLDAHNTSITAHNTQATTHNIDANVRSDSINTLTIDQLPPEIINNIAEFLEPKFLMTITQVNKQFKEIATRILTTYSSQLLQQHNNNPDKALLDAATNNLPYMVRYLIQNGAYVNTKDDDGRTALMLAANKNNQVIVTQLLKANADVMASDNFGRTALIVAKDHNYEAITEMLETITKNLLAQLKYQNRKNTIVGCAGFTVAALGFAFFFYAICSINPNSCNMLNHTVNNALFNNTQ